ncbi:MAG: 23S rRNA (adenine(2503)-C(2))-methyltransferase RlmN, partial [Campylobacter sp.]|nr:23S rRNA (adenine(2503)-C(2))-methyltransferase RlmN [Campylobacter sp.]
NKISTQNGIGADKISSAKTRGRAGANEPTIKTDGGKDQVFLTSSGCKTGPESAVTTQNLTNVEKK